MSNVSIQQAAARLLAIKKATSSFQGFIEYRHPDWTLAPFQQLLITALDLLERHELYSDFLQQYVVVNRYSPSLKIWKATLEDRGPQDPNRYKVRNLMINMPPRHAKSTFSTVEFPAYYMLRKPERFNMTCSYNSQLAIGFGRQVREIITDPMILEPFQKETGFEPSKESRSAEEWRTTDGGAYFGVGLGGTTSGRPATLLGIDDPIKARKEAESMTNRNTVWDYYTASLDTRLQPEVDGTPPAKIVCLTRWHPDDLGGRIIASEDWKDGLWLHINFPAIETIEIDSSFKRCDLPATHSQHDPASNDVVQTTAQIDKPLWHERFPLEDLKLKQRRNSRDFEALYQQNPYLKGGNIIKANWWNYYDPNALPERFTAIVIGSDTAFKKTETADYSVLVVGGLAPSGDIYILNVIRGRYDFPELKQRCRATNMQYRGQGLRGFYIEDKASGQSLIQELKRESGMVVIPVKVSTDKVTRVNAVTPLIEGGRVWLPQNAPWLDEFIEEMLAFPDGTHDDQADALAITLDALSRMHVDVADFSLVSTGSESLQQQFNHLQENDGSALSKLMNSSLISQTKQENSVLGGFNNSKNWRGWGM